MGATPAALSTYIQANEPAITLKALTNFGSNSAGSVDTTVLLEYCGKAIRWFESRYVTYDPDNYGIHQDIAHLKAMQILYSRTNDTEKIARIEKDLAELLDDFKRARTLYPVTDAVRTPTADDSTKTPPMEKNGSWLDGWRAKD